MIGVARAAVMEAKILPFTITSNQNNVDLYAFAISRGYPGSGDVTITIAAGVVIGSVAANLPSLVPGSWPSSVVVTLEILGLVLGAGGNGGMGASPSIPTRGGDGGTAIDASAVSGFTFKVDATAVGAGVKGGGGGGGGGDVSNTVTGGGCCPTIIFGGAGGGGGGGQGSSGGTGGPKGLGGGTFAPGSDGTTGDITAPGSGGAGGPDSANPGTPGGSGGNGGAFGTAGSAGTTTGSGGGGAAGGAAGRSINGYSKVTGGATNLTGPTAG